MQNSILKNILRAREIYQRIFVTKLSLKLTRYLVMFFFFLFVFSESKPAKQTTDATFDVFPLHVGMVYKYNYDFYSAYYEFMLVSLAADSGLIEYSVTSQTFTDSCIFWGITEVANLKIRRYARGRYDSIYFQRDSTSLILTEVLPEFAEGKHEIRCSSRVWSFPLTSPSQVIYRYSDTSRTLIVHPAGYGYDSLWFSSDSGFSSRNRYAFFSGVTQWSSRTKVKLLQFMTSSPEHVEPSNSFVLLQNYPNPFNPTTNIEFRIGNFGFVSLKVYDLLGREVATLVNEELKPGSYRRVFGGSGLASGVYLYRLRAGSLCNRENSYYLDKKQILSRIRVIGIRR